MSGGRGSLAAGRKVAEESGKEDTGRRRRVPEGVSGVKRESFFDIRRHRASAARSRGDESETSETSGVAATGSSAKHAI